MATKRMNENWRRMKNQIRSTWGDCEFSDKEMRRARGNLPNMVELIHQKSGDSAAQIRQKMSAMI